jgi:hypothetical protein
LWGLTCRLQRLAAGAAGGFVGAVHQLEHGGNGVLVSRVYVQQDTLQRHVLVQLAVGLLGTARSGQSEELRDGKQVVVQGLGRLLLGLVLDLRQRSLVLLLELLRQILLEGGLLGVQATAVFLVDLQVLGQLLLELGELGLEAGLLENLGLLVGIDDLGGNKLVEALVRVAGDQGVGLGCIGLSIARLAWEYMG